VAGSRRRWCEVALCGDSGPPQLLPGVVGLAGCHRTIPPVMSRLIPCGSRSDFRVPMTRESRSGDTRVDTRSIRFPGWSIPGDPKSQAPHRQRRSPRPTVFAWSLRRRPPTLFVGRVFSGRQGTFSQICTGSQPGTMAPARPTRELHDTEFIRSKHDWNRSSGTTPPGQ